MSNTENIMSIPKQCDLIAEIDDHMRFLILRKRLGVQDKELAFLLGISTRAMTERVTGRAGIKKETILAMKQLLQERNQI